MARQSFTVRRAFYFRKVDVKTCSRCACVKPHTQFSKKHDTRDGYASYCKSCSSEFRKKWAAAKPNYVKQYNAAYREANRERLIEYGRKRYAENADLMAEKAKDYRERNKETTLAKARAYREANREACIATVKRWREQNQASWYAEWAAKNRAYIRAKNNARRAAELRAIPNWADDKLVREFYETADALNMWTGEWYHVDHIVPLRGRTVCGLHTQANLQILPAKENLSKRNVHWPDQP